MPSRSYIFYGLNVVRMLSIVALLLAFSSSIVVVVSDIRAVNKFQHDPSSNDQSCGYIEGSTVPDQPAGVFWAVLNRLFIAFQLVFLLLSELSWPIAFFNRYFPVLGSEFGLGALGIFQTLIGATILSHHVDDFTLVSAFFLFSVGCLNAVLGLIFREHAKSKRSIRARKENDAGALPMHTGDIGSPTLSTSIFGGGNSAGASKPNGFGFGVQGEKRAGLKGFMISRPTESVSRYASRPVSVGSLLSRVEPEAAEPEPENNKGTPMFRSSPIAI